MYEQRDARTMQTNGEEARTLLLEISNAMVRIYKEQFGREPTRTRTEWAGPDTLVCTLRDSFTRAEQRLVQMGELQRLRESRLFFQYATEDEFKSAIERIIGRKVVGFVSGIDATQDISTEVFYLEPEAG